MENERLGFKIKVDDKEATLDSADGGNGLILNGETSAAPRGILLRFDAPGPGTRARMDWVRKCQGWDPRTFKLGLKISNNTIWIGGYDWNPRALPKGRYEFQVDVADLKVRNNPITVEVRDNKVAHHVVEAKEDPRRVELRADLGSFDPKIKSLLGSQKPKLDGMAPWEWLVSDSPRERRKACLLNLLAKLRTTPTQSKPLIDDVESILFADVDRIYCKVKSNLCERLVQLSEGPTIFYDEGQPHSGTHKRLLGFVNAASSYKLRSFRQEGRPSMQVTVARNEQVSEPVYADVDLDLGNPLQDVAGFLIHLGEIVMPGRTDHFKLHKKLLKDGGDFIYYEIGRKYG